MKTRLIFIVLFLFFSAVHFVHAETPTAVKDLSATIKMMDDKDKIEKDEPIRLTYTLTNNSTKEVYILRWGTPLEGFMSNMLDVRTAGGDKVAYDGFLASRVGPLPEDYVQIDAGKSITVELPVHEGYKVHAMGDYTIKLPRKTVLDAVHVKPAAGVMIKRKFVPAAVKMTKQEAIFYQKEQRPRGPAIPVPKSTAPVNNRLPQPAIPAPPHNMQPGILGPPQNGQPGIPVSPHNMQPGIPVPPQNVQPETPGPPHNMRLINEAPYPPYRYGLESGLISYANYDPNEQYAPQPEDIQSRLKIDNPEQRKKVRDAYVKAYGLAAESKVFVNAGDSVARKADRFTKLFGASDPVSAEDNSGFCKEWTDKFGQNYQAFGERFTSVKLTFGNIYNLFFETAPERLVRFFGGRNSVQEPRNGKKYTEAVKEVYPCDYRSVVAYVYTGETRPIIYLCDSFFNPPAGVQIDKAGAIIHELSHLANTEVDDWAYEYDECSEVALCVPYEAPKNADNYHLFASNPKGLGLGLEPGHWYAHFRTADGYYLSAGAGGTLNATNTDSSLCSNCTFVLEAVGTTATATELTLKDGQTVRLLTIDRQNALSATGGIVQTDSTSQKAFWVKKKGSGESITGGEITTGDAIYLEPVAGGTRLNVTTGAGNKNDFFNIELAR